jgi:hypothetical protein
MSEYSKLLDTISRKTDPDELRLLMARAKEKGIKEVHEAAFRRLVEVLPTAAPGTIEHDFWKSITAFEEILTAERGRTTRLGRTRQKVQRVGVAQTLSDWATGGASQGFDMLIDLGLPELTGEAVVLRHSDHFEHAVVTAARERLHGAGYDSF